MTGQTRIKFNFHPNDREGHHAVEKADASGNKHRYLYGISTGVKKDGHGERMTENAIQSITKQAQSGDVLLYADRHGVAYTEDIGILSDFHVDNNGDWKPEFRLYDKSDGLGANTLETADKLWRQMLGLPPYKKPKQKGFSVEGYIPDGGILQMSFDGKRVINDMILDGVVVVPRPAYQSSVVHAIYKALGETAPWVVQKSIKESLRAKIQAGESDTNYFRKRYQIQEALEDNIEEIMQDEEVEDKEDRLIMLFDEYRDMMLEVILGSQNFFMPDIDPTQAVVENIKVNKDMNPKIVLFKSLLSNLDTVQKILEKQGAH